MTTFSKLVFMTFILFPSVMVRAEIITYDLHDSQIASLLGQLDIDVSKYFNQEINNETSLIPDYKDLIAKIRASNSPSCWIIDRVITEISCPTSEFELSSIFVLIFKMTPVIPNEHNQNNIEQFNVLLQQSENIYTKTIESKKGVMIRSDKLQTCMLDLSNIVQLNQFSIGQLYQGLCDAICSYLEKEELEWPHFFIRVSVDTDIHTLTYTTVAGKSGQNFVRTYNKVKLLSPLCCSLL